MSVRSLGAIAQAPAADTCGNAGSPFPEEISGVISRFNEIEFTLVSARDYTFRIQIRDYLVSRKTCVYSRDMFKDRNIRANTGTLTCVSLSI